MIQKLFLWWNSSSSELFLQEFEEFWVFFWWNWLARYNEIIFWNVLALWLGTLYIIKEFSTVLIAIINSNGSSADSNVKTNSEVLWLERHIWAILLDDHLSLQEGSLWGTTIDLLWLRDQDRSVLKEVVYDEFPNSVVFKPRLYHRFFEISEKS